MIVSLFVAWNNVFLIKRKLSGLFLKSQLYQWVINTLTIRSGPTKALSFLCRIKYIQSNFLPGPTCTTLHTSLWSSPRLHRELAHDAGLPACVSEDSVRQEGMQAGCVACSACAEQNGGRQVHPLERLEWSPVFQSEGLLWNWRSILGIVPVTQTVVKLPLGKDL